MRALVVSATLAALLSLTATGRADRRPTRARPEGPRPASPTAAPRAEGPRPASPTGPATAPSRGERPRPSQATPVAVQVAADAPAPPTDPLKKTQPPEYGKQPAKREIRKLEDTIYVLEKPSSTLWRWRDDPEGAYARDQTFITKQLAELDAVLTELTAKQPDWRRLAEYQVRLAHLAKGHAAQRAHYAAVETARADAVAAADAAAQAAWLAKRAQDDGVAAGLHAASVGKVVFARGAFTRTTTVGQLVTTIDAAAPLHARVYLAESPWNALHTAGIDCGAGLERYWLTTHVTIGSGATYELETRGLDRATFQGRTAIDPIGPGSLTAGGTFTNPDEATAGFGWIARVAGELTPGRTRVTLAVHAACAAGQHGVEVAAGTIEIEATAASLAELIGRGQFKMTASFHPPKALAKIRSLLAARYAADAELIDLRSAGEWQPRRNDYGVVLARELPVVAVIRRRTGGCKLMSVMISEPFDGQTYGPALNLASELGRPFVCNPR